MKQKRQELRRYDSSAFVPYCTDTGSSSSSNALVLSFRLVKDVCEENKEISRLSRPVKGEAENCGQFQVGFSDHKLTDRVLICCNLHAFTPRKRNEARMQLFGNVEQPETIRKLDSQVKAISRLQLTRTLEVSAQILL